MLQIGLLLHFYQPSTQFSEVFEKISRLSYEPLLSLFEEYPETPLTVNLGGSLLDLWSTSGRGIFLDRWKALLKKGKIEVVSSAKYHPLLFRLPPSEIERQIALHEKTLKDLLGLPKPSGFFPPEMAYSRAVAESLAKMGYRCLLLDRSAKPGVGFPDRPEMSKDSYRIRGLPLQVLFRDPSLSYLIAFALIREPRKLQEILTPFINANGYIMLAMDAETFGWHRKSQLQFLRRILEMNAKNSPSLHFKLSTISQICSGFPPKAETEPLESTWGVFQETDNRRIFSRWDNPRNPVHLLQWRLLQLAISVAGGDLDTSLSRQFLDRGEQSDQFWWASADPCWLPPMVRAGGDLLEKAVLTSPAATDDQRKEASRLSSEIIKIGIEKFGRKPKKC